MAKRLTVRKALHLAANVDELKPCPFCGGKAERLDFDFEEVNPNCGGSCIECTICQASGPVHFDRKENLCSSWNNRVGYSDALRKAARMNTDAAAQLKWVGQELAELCEATEDEETDDETTINFFRGRRYEAKAIRRSMLEIIRERIEDLNQSANDILDDDDLYPGEDIDGPL